MIYKFNWIEKLLLRTNILPHPLTDVASNVGLAKALGVAVKLGITDQLSQTAKPVNQIAQQSGTSPKGTEIILDCLQALGYAQRVGNGYAFTRQGMKFLHKESPQNFRYFILFNDWAYDSFLNLEETISQGEQSRPNYSYFTPHVWELFSRAMTELARTNVDEVTAKISLSNPKRLLDLGGSHGLYSVALCKKYPTLSATIMDFEPVRPYATEIIESHQMQDRVDFLAADFMRDPLLGKPDAALLFQIIHGNTEEANQSLFKKIHASLASNGQLIVLEQIRGIGGKSQLSQATTSYMALNLFHQANGNTYSFEEVSDWARAVGFRKTQLKRLRAPGFGLITCEK